MLDENAPAAVRLEASEKRLDRLIGKAAQRIDARAPSNRALCDH
jgi:hypothetical protein